LTGNTAEIALPVRAGYRPNVYVTATLVRASRDLEPGGVGRAYGAVPLDVERAANRLAVGLAAPDEIRPHAPLTVEVTAAPGASVTVAAVDEGILQLIAQKTPDPFGFFYRKLALGVRSFDIFALLLPEVKPDETVAPAGGDGALAPLDAGLRAELRRKDSVAFWSGVVRADEAGRASVT